MNANAETSCEGDENTIRIHVEHRGIPTWIEVPCIRIGPFAIFDQELIGKHFEGAYNPGWSLTHVKSGMAAVPDAPSENACRIALTHYMQMPVSWDFADPEAVKQWSSECRATARRIRDSAIHGGFGP